MSMAFCHMYQGVLKFIYACSSVQVSIRRHCKEIESKQLYFEKMVRLIKLTGYAQVQEAAPTVIVVVEKDSWNGAEVCLE